MKVELQAKLRRRFPFLNPPPKKGRKYLMPLDFGLAIGDGWYDLFYRLCETVEKELAKDPDLTKDFEVFQVKEKYALIRVYVSSANDAIFKAIDDAEKRSSQVCEYCGKRGSMKNVEGWYKTLCKKCYQGILDDRVRRKANSVAESLGAYGRARDAISRIMLEKTRRGGGR